MMRCWSRIHSPVWVRGAGDAVDAFGHGCRVAAEHRLLADELDLFVDAHEFGDDEFEFCGGLGSAGEALLQDLELAFEAVAQFW